MICRYCQHQIDQQLIMRISSHLMVRFVEKVDSYNGFGLGLSPVLRSHRLEAFWDDNEDDDQSVVWTGANCSTQAVKGDMLKLSRVSLIVSGWKAEYVIQTACTLCVLFYLSVSTSPRQNCVQYCSALISPMAKTSNSNKLINGVQVCFWPEI